MYVFALKRLLSLSPAAKTSSTLCTLPVGGTGRKHSADFELLSADGSKTAIWQHPKQTMNKMLEKESNCPSATAAVPSLANAIQIQQHEPTSPRDHFGAAGLASVFIEDRLTASSKQPKLRFCTSPKCSLREEVADAVARPPILGRVVKQWFEHAIGFQDRQGFAYRAATQTCGLPPLRANVWS